MYIMHHYQNVSDQPIRKHITSYHNQSVTNSSIGSNSNVFGPIVTFPREISDPHFSVVYQRHFSHHSKLEF